MHQHDEVEAAVGEGQRVHVALADFDVREGLEAFARRGDHARAGVDADVAVGMRREQLGEDAIAGGDVQHVARTQQRKRRARQRFPGAAGRVMALHVAGHRVGPVLVGRAHGQHAGDAFGVLAQQCVVAAAAQRVPQGQLRGVQGLLVER
jgi:hypothetical protein